MKARCSSSNSFPRQPVSSLTRYDSFWIFSFHVLSLSKISSPWGQFLWRTCGTTLQNYNTAKPFLSDLCLCSIDSCSLQTMNLPPIMKRRGTSKGSVNTTIGLSRKRGRNEDGLTPFIKMHPSRRNTSKTNTRN